MARGAVGCVRQQPMAALWIFLTEFGGKSAA
ncbi:hypothetical protein HNR42_000902 [Deinobacterium chartae]|uniref:Uncharacterized protein n=1 Tax=Deinobacterium chartae TaxID=521158 RepID=A0A841I0H6_9DEIO|nr:hypothetical protein [Deinobacterium chartae]